MQPVLNPKFIKIVKRLYLKFFALYILIALSVYFVLPENINKTVAACAGFVSLMEQLYRDQSVRGACGVLRRCDADG